ncbi:50S ribosomal protein L3 [Candidatus Shapirobacteria bacterium CG08_land_8_20_14_0_20_39_18]|uniref:Large ribosomal subunit protein uL3 n=1 Tax=Candidatus Shapirobacteria bacterium CG08_land_8_20_14_0_20_39_18 TaxID=1974883 RepID=A0A2M6XC56_9BACT|nr:MAG: 50S ribosomal protein L3 [Candidatus Shapirobacteria bacterium CG08_land_8_20_14_0_20_39_18]PJE68432.1 MAG: 50S ribosomal protein L3 [Candidatus Shapirobacteria bacterium CG10_big_fil_rev_8_21_14_0_10_38_8]
MANAILGIKVSQSQRFDEKGIRYPVTLINAGPCLVVQIKTTEKDGYNALKVGFGTKKTKTAGKTTHRFLREISVNPQEISENLQPGSEIKIGNVLKIGDVVDVMGISKGKGFAGAVKRYHFKGGPRTHGQSDRERAPGSIGTTTTPGRVLKGKRMAGHMGSDNVTVRNLKVMEIDPEKNLLVVKGLIPGPVNGLVEIEVKHGVNN